MKIKTSLLLLAAALVLALSACSASVAEGWYSCEEHFEKGALQDHTDYCKYYYHSAEELELGAYTELGADVSEVRSYFENFSEWMSVQDREEEYDFDADCIGEGDYVLIKDREGEAIGDGKYEKFEDYTVYFFDTDTSTLYYIHTNI